MSKTYRDLVAWQRAMDLVERIYETTKSFPQDERFGLVAQLRRAAVSVPSNIAEGRGRGGHAEFLRFLGIAYGSLMEVETQLEIADRLGYLPHEGSNGLQAATSEVGKLLNGLKTAIRRKM